MDHLYAEGTFIAAKNDPYRKLLIKRYLGRVYYCTAVDDPTNKLLAFFERELVVTVATA
jgi:hypothetical protein